MKKIIPLVSYFFILSTLTALPHTYVPIREIVQIQDGHTGTIKEIVFSPDSKYIAASGDDYTIRIWDYEHDRLLGVLPLFREITTMQFSKDNCYLAACTDDKILLWDIKANKVFYPTFIDKFTFTSIAFTDDNANLIVTGHTRNIYFIDVHSHVVNQVLRDSEDNYQYISYINITPDKKNIVAAGIKIVKRSVGRIFTKNIETGELSSGRYIVAKHNSRIKSLAYSPDATLLLSVAYDGRINFFSTSENIKYVTTSEEGSWMHPLALFFPGKNDTIAFIDNSENIRIGIVKKKEESNNTVWSIESTGTIGKPGVSAFAFSPDGRYIAIGNGNELNICQNNDFHSVKSYSGEREIFYSLAFSPDGKIVASGGENIVLWDCTTGKLLKKLKNTHDMIYKQLHFINNTMLIARKETFDGDFLRSNIDIFDLEKGNVMILPAGIPIAFSVYKEDYIALSQVKYGEDVNNYTVEILDLESNKSVMTIESDQRINDLAFSSNGTIVAGGCIDGTIQLWNTSDRKLYFKLDKSNGPIIALQFSPDERYLAYSDTIGMFYLWDVRNKKYIIDGKKYPSPLTSLNFSPDNLNVIAVGNSAVYSIACDQKNKEVTIRGHSATIYMGLYSPDGDKIVTVSKDGTLKWWHNMDTRLLATSLVFPASYLTYSPEGYYYTPDNKNERILWYYEGLFLQDGLQDSMKQPDIIIRILAGEKIEVPEKKFKEIAQKFNPEKYMLDTKGPTYTENSPEYWYNNSEYGKKYAIVIGISDYEQLNGETKYAHLSDLKYAHKDARAFEDFLLEQSNRGNGDWDITTITNEEATSAKVDNVLSRVLISTKEEDLIFIFFSGHARKHPSTNDLYLLTYDFKLDDYRSGYDYRDLNDLIARSKARYIITFIDACFSGFPGNAKGDRNLLQNKIDSLKLPENKVMITSSRGEELSYEYDKLQLGLFTYYLLKGLRGDAKEINNNQFVEIQELIPYLENKISAYSDNKQHPNEFGVTSEIKYNFPLAVR